MEFKPSYDTYRRIIRDIKETGRGGISYHEAVGMPEFIVMRHDVEFSMERAYDMSMVESGMDFRSTYFVQITNNSYNALSKRNIDMMRDMAYRGHEIGLHYHLNGQRDALAVRDGVRDQMRIMSEMLGMPVTTYSFHRPVKEIYYYNIRIDGTINAYSPEFFTYAENVGMDTELEVKYIADSKHRWNYGYPDLATFGLYPKIQILIHPFSWTEQGYDNLDNFRSLIEEKQSVLIDTMDEEFMRFREIRGKIEKETRLNQKRQNIE